MIFVLSRRVATLGGHGIGTGRLSVIVMKVVAAFEVLASSFLPLPSVMSASLCLLDTQVRCATPLPSSICLCLRRQATCLRRSMHMGLRSLSNPGKLPGSMVFIRYTAAIRTCPVAHVPGRRVLFIARDGDVFLCDRMWKYYGHAIIIPVVYCPVAYMM